MSQQFTPNNPLPQGAKVPQEMAVFSPEVEAEIERAPGEVSGDALGDPADDVHRAARARRYLDPPGVAYLADRLGVRITDIWEVATFYSMMNTEPVGKYHSRSARRSRARSWARARSPSSARKRLGIKPGETTD